MRSEFLFLRSISEKDDIVTMVFDKLERGSHAEKSFGGR